MASDCHIDVKNKEQPSSGLDQLVQFLDVNPEVTGSNHVLLNFSLSKPQLRFDIQKKIGLDCKRKKMKLDSFRETLLSGIFITLIADVMSKDNGKE